MSELYITEQNKSLSICGLDKKHEGRYLCRVKTENCCKTAVYNLTLSDNSTAIPGTSVYSTLKTSFTAKPDTSTAIPDTSVYSTSNTSFTAKPESNTTLTSLTMTTERMTTVSKTEGDRQTTANPTESPGGNMPTIILVIVVAAISITGIVIFILVRRQRTQHEMRDRNAPSTTIAGPEDQNKEVVYTTVALNPVPSSSKPQINETSEYATIKCTPGDPTSTP
ncbi:uncharacterized protein LOC122809295 isoform X1 [Protopterus annectens]|uniref:uncharacterized protein LOC122809295 isoform X1 n=1 Tax=Protopterus annectens TaxID=7888 RepID=UPI001CF9B729|nr:uncharacterized protein LOC122809295 isoform X1 [Protopterus annectens]